MGNSQSAEAGLLLAGRYRLGETIGRGGMGRVWRAHDEVLHRVVAVKELTAGMYASEPDRAVLHARTRKEARAAARITHPGVVTVHDVLDHDARPWIVMQYVDGRSLAEAVKESGRIPVPEAARIGARILRALEAAHAAGVLHRDVKPANVLLSRDGQILITDFGIAAIEGDSTITRTGEIVGSIDYLAPERVRGGDPGPASDLWSLGATLYTAVEGTSPFRRSSPLSTMQAVVGEEPRPPEHAGPLTPVIMALLDKDPAARPSAEQTGRMLRAVTEGKPPEPRAERPTLRQPNPFPGTSPSTSLSAFPGPAASPDTPADAFPDAPTNPSMGASTGTSTGPVPDQPSRARARVRWRAGRLRTGRLRTVAIAVVLSAVVGIGAGLTAMRYSDDTDGRERTVGEQTEAARKNLDDPPATVTGSPDAKEAKDAKAAPDVPDGWRRVSDPAGFSLLVPEGWKRQLNGKQIDYAPDDGRYRIRIGIESAPDFENPYKHLLALEEIQKTLPDYRRVRLEPNDFRDRPKSAVWEFSWTEGGSSPGPRRAIDQMYYGDDGTEYALYMTGPAADWATTRERFDIMLQSWEPPK
ncbi:serine/threonine-protein kinase [Streptomyces jumonjinensis]|uniref:serine/threonine-protein kinase n=1 Tax=Streptomyces jumonjinensis TaxID=1945 RepID=UPI0037A376BF